MKFNTQQFQSQTSYESSLYFVTWLLNQGIFSLSEYNQAKAYLIGKYKPIIEH